MSPLKALMDFEARSMVMSWRVAILI